MPNPVAYVAVVYPPSPAIAAKIGAADHGHVTFDEVREAVVLTQVKDSWWDDDPTRGSRMILIGTTGEGRTLVVVLYPVDESDGTWNLGTAYVGE